MLAAVSATYREAAAADEYAPATMTVSAFLDKVHNAGGKLLPGAYHRVSRTRNTAGDVWTDDTYSSGPDYRTTVTQGTFVSAYGSYDGKAWSQNVNGFVTASTGYFAEADPFSAALRKPVDSNSTLKLFTVMSASSPEFVLEITPLKGLVERDFYDASTFLLNRVEELDFDGHHRLWQYGDYRPESGQTIAHSIAFSVDGVPRKQTEVVSYERVAAVGLNLAMPASHPLFAVHDGDAVTIPARFTDDGIVVRVTVDGRGLDFVLDSGASSMLIDAGVARELGMQQSGAVNYSFGGDFTMTDTRAATFSVAGLNASGVALSSTDFTEQGDGQRIVGLLGCDFIASGVLEVDFDKQAVTLLASAPPDLAAKGWSVLPLRLDDCVPVLKATFSGIDGHFVADTGAYFTTLYPHYFDQFHIPVPRGEPDREQMEFIGGKSFGVKHFTMNRLILADWIFGSAQVVVPSASYAQDLDYDGLIGRDTLSTFNLIFDYKSRQLWFKQIAL
jgi:hypothetical protein